MHWNIQEIHTRDPRPRKATWPQPTRNVTEKTSPSSHCPKTNTEDSSSLNELEAGGKPSTWFPPAEIVELSANKNILEQDVLMKTWLFLVFYVSFCIFNIFWNFHFSYPRHHFSSVSLIVAQKTISFDDVNLAFLFTSNFEIFEHLEFLQFSDFFKKSVFQIWNMIFQSYEFSEPEINIIWYREAYIYVFDRF